MGHETKDAGRRGKGVSAHRGPSVWNSRLAVMSACALVAGLTVLVYVREAWLAAMAVIWGDGLLAVGWVIGAAMLGSLIVPRLRSADGQSIERPLYLVSSAAMGLGLFSLAALGLGLGGLLTREMAILLPVSSAIIWVAGLMLRQGNISLRPQMDCLEQWLRQPTGWGWCWLVAMPFLGITLASATLPPGILWKPGDPHPYDVLEYHLQVPREWYEAGRIEPLKHNVFGYFPFNVEMQYLLAMHVRGGPWAGMYLAQLMSAAYMVLAVAGVYAVVRATAPPETDRSGAAVLAGVAAATTPWLSMLGSVAYNEAGLLLYGTLAIGWAVVALRAGGWRHTLAALAVGGAMAGLASGVKYTGVPLLLVALPGMLVVIAGVWAIRRNMAWRPVMVGAGVYAAVGLVAVSPWLVRNWVWTGNPVFPEAMNLLGRAHFSEAQVERWEQAHSQRPDQKPWGRRLDAGWQQVVTDWRYGYVLLPLALVVAGVGARRVQVAFLLAMLAALAEFWLGLTHLQSRFFVLAIPLAAMLLGTLRRRGMIAAGMGVMVLAAVPSLVMLDRTLSPTMDIMRRSGAVGIGDLTVFLPEKVAQLIASGGRIALVGDAQAFAYAMPMGDLRYRTIFDFDEQPGRSFLDAWLGEDARQVKFQYSLVIDRAELVRFWETYARIPLPESLKGGGEPVVVPAEATEGDAAE